MLSDKILSNQICKHCGVTSDYGSNYCSKICRMQWLFVLIWGPLTNYYVYSMISLVLTIALFAVIFLTENNNAAVLGLSLSILIYYFLSFICKFIIDLRDKKRSNYNIME